MWNKTLKLFQNYFSRWNYFQKLLVENDGVCGRATIVRHVLLFLLFPCISVFIHTCYLIHPSLHANVPVWGLGGCKIRVHSVLWLVKGVPNQDVDCSVLVSLLCLRCMRCFVSLFSVVSICANDCPERLVSEMTCCASSGALNHTHSLTLQRANVPLFPIPSLPAKKPSPHIVTL